jgi:prevent-host-death family protein
MIHVNMHEAKTRLSELVALVEKNHEVVRICRNGTPVAALVPLAPVVDPLEQHEAIRDIKVLYDPAQPLDDDEWPEGLRG